MNSESYNLYSSPYTQNYLIEYRGNFKEEIDSVDYAVGTILTDTLGIISVFEDDINKLIKSVPSIVYIDFRTLLVLQDISPEYVDNINNIKINPYLNLTGKDVIVGVVDTGIDYLNEEFIRPDGTSRILLLWDQTIDNTDEENPEMYIGKIYNNSQINEAIALKIAGGDPYSVVPSKDEIGHGTKVCGIIGARGYSQKFKGIASQCSFIIVKLAQSANIKKQLLENLVTDVPAYDISELCSAINFLSNSFYNFPGKPMVIYIGVGFTEGSHDGTSLLSRYISSVGSVKGICIVSGVGNEGNSQGHAVGYISSVGSSSVQQLKIPVERKLFRISIWVQKPNKVSLRVISPTDESSQIIKPKLNIIEFLKFIFIDTEFTVTYRTPDNFTGHEMIHLFFKDIKPGIWKIELIGEYIINGRYDIWLPPHAILPKDLVFLTPNQFNTITIPSTANNTIAVSYYGSNNAVLASSGKGFATSNMYNRGIRPDIATIGTNIITTQPSGGTALISGSSAASAIITGACALLLEWGIVRGNDKSMYSRKIRSYLIYGTTKNPIYKFPNRDLGYGVFNLLGTFNVIAQLYNNIRSSAHRNNQSFEKLNDYFNNLIINYLYGDFIEYNINNIFVRIPKNSLGDFVWQKIL